MGALPANDEWSVASDRFEGAHRRIHSARNKLFGPLLQPPAFI
jgi:hypothetical protein